jgi:hypothetical protein
VGAVDPGDVEALTGGDVATIVPIVTALAKGYTRGRGFDGVTPNQDVAAVIVTASARLAANTGQLPVDEVTGPFSRSVRGAFQGWTLAELIVLNRYRVRAM